MRRGPATMMRWAAAAGCAVLPFLSAFGTGLSEPERLQFADGLFARGMYEVAAVEYNGFLKDFPEAARKDVVYFRLGDCYRQLNKPVEAEQAYRTVFTKFPDSAYRLRAGCKRADLFMGTGQYDAARELFEAVIKLNPPPDIAAACRYFMAEAYLKTDRPEQARPVLEQVVRDYPESLYRSYALLKLGRLLVSGQEAARGMELLTQAAEKGASARVRAEALFQMAESHFEAGSFTQSAEQYRRLLADYPDDDRSVEARLRGAWASYRAGLFANALESATAAAAEGSGAGGPADGRARAAEWLYVKANSERQLMKHAESIDTYTKLIERYPESSFAEASRYEKAVVFFKMGQFDKAIVEATPLMPDGALRKDVYWLLAESHAALKQDDQAIQYYRLLLRDFPDSDVSCDATYRLAHHLQTKGEHKEAARHYHLVAEKFPEHELAPQSLFAAAVCLLRENLEAEAARDWAALITRYPQSPLVEKALYQKAMCDLRLERNEEAAGALHDLLKRFPASDLAADAHYWQGMLLLKTGKLEDAVAAFRLSLKASPRQELERDAMFHLGTALQQGGHHAEAVNCFITLVGTPAREKLSPRLLLWMAEYLYDQKRYDESMVTAHLLLDTDATADGQQAAWVMLGRNHAVKGERESARDAFAKALAAQATTRFAAESALRLAEIEFAEGKATNAVNHFSQAAALAGDESQLGVRARAYAGLGHAAKARGDWADAARYFMSVAILYDDAQLVPGCLHEAAEAFRQSGNDASAKEALAELQARYPDSPEARTTAAATPAPPPAAPVAP